MGVYLYDNALLNKFKKWTAGTPCMVLGVDETKQLFEIQADVTNDKLIELPLIAITRKGGYSILQKAKRPTSYMGATMQVSNEKGAKLNVIPISISYQIDIYTRYLREADEYARNIVFNIVNYPKLTIDIPYENLNLSHNSNIRLSSDIEDNSDIPERLVPGQFTRLSVGIEIDDAFLFDVRIRDNLSIADIQAEALDISIN